MQVLKNKPDLKILSSQEARMALAIADFSRENLGADWRGSSLLVAFSGGADSTALLWIAACLREYFQCRVAAAHLDHGLRKESPQDAAHAEALCCAMNVDFYCERQDIALIAQKAKAGIEDTGRRQRYAFLERIRHKLSADWVLTAHHVGDLAEDMLMRLSRGTGWPALGGMRGRVGKVIRPLLLQEKTSLVNMLERLEVPWQEDASNNEMEYKRNRVRHQLVPLMLAENPSFFDSVRHLWHMARIDEEYWQQKLQKIELAESENQLLLTKEYLQGLAKAARLRLYAQAIKKLNKGQARASSLFALDKAFIEQRHNKVFQFSGEVQARLDKKGILFQAKTGPAT